MKSKFQKAGTIILTVILIFLLFMGFLYLNNDIGIRQSNLQKDIRSSQKITVDWTVDGNVSDTMAAFISYPKDQSDHTFSVYVNRPGFSFGYFFRGGGSISEVEEYIAAYTVEGWNERAFISMNKQRVDRLEIYDGHSVQAITIDSNKPFALVLPVNAGAISFYDADGNTVPFLTRPL